MASGTNFSLPINSCLNPVHVKECSPLSLAVVESLLGQILTQVTAVNANTDNIENQLTSIISELTTANTNLATIIASLANILVELQQIDANTDGIEGLLTNIISVITSEGNQTQALLLQIFNKLNEPCTGSPQNVVVCNQISTTAIENLLSNILTQVTAIEENTDTLEALLTQANTILSAIEVDVEALLPVLNNIFLELQAIDANTDQVESILTAIITSITTEGNETQALLQQLVNKMNEPCTGSPQNVIVCNLDEFIADCGNNGASGSLFTLLTKLELGDLTTAFPGIVQVGDVPTGSTATEPTDGFNVSGWNLFAICASALPPNDSNGGRWYAGPFEGQSSLAGSIRSNPDPSCATEPALGDKSFGVVVCPTQIQALIDAQPKPQNLLESNCAWFLVGGNKTHVQIRHLVNPITGLTETTVYVDSITGQVVTPDNLTPVCGIDFCNP